MSENLKFRDDGIQVVIQRKYKEHSAFFPYRDYGKRRAKLAAILWRDAKLAKLGPARRKKRGTDSNLKLKNIYLGSSLKKGRRFKEYKVISHNNDTGEMNSFYAGTENTIHQRLPEAIRKAKRWRRYGTT